MALCPAGANKYGGLAHLVERLNGIEKVGSSILPTSTTFKFAGVLMKVCAWASRCLHFLPPVEPRVRVVPSLAQVISELLAAKKVANLRPKYLKGLKLYLEQFASGRELLPISEISVRELEAWFAERNEASSTRSSNTGRLASLFSFAVRRGYMAENPTKRMERIHIERKTPEIFTPAQCRLALDFAEQEFPRFLPWLVLAMFCGVRPEELDKLSWQAVNLPEKIITIDAAVSKVRRRRLTPIPAVALAWLKFGGDLPLPLSSRRRYVRRIRDRLGMEDWPQDVLRHTAASYTLAIHQDAPKVAMWLGNSPKILLRDYQQLVSANAAAEFWGLLPLCAAPVPCPEKNAPELVLS